MALTVELETSEALRALDDLRRRQVPFATARALTQTAADAQRVIRSELPDRFVIRSRWLEQGIRTERATKREPVSVVYSRDPFMVEHETGGRRRGRKGVRAIPRAIRKTPKQRITPARRPAAILKRKRTYVGPIREGSSTEAIFQRVGKSGRRLLYVLEPRPVKIAARWGFGDTAAKTARRVWARNFGRAFAQAIRSAR